MNEIIVSCSAMHQTTCVAQTTAMLFIEFVFYLVLFVQMFMNMEIDERCASPASSISLDEISAGHDNSVLTVRTVSTTALSESILEESFAAAIVDVSQHWIRVSGLDANTTNSSLREVFYHHGANDAFVVGKADGGRKIGFVSFSHQEMVSLAIEKVNRFVPLRQTAPLTVERVDSKAIRREVSEPLTQKGQLSSPAYCLWEMALHPPNADSLLDQLNHRMTSGNDSRPFGIKANAVAASIVEGLHRSNAIQRLNLATLLLNSNAQMRMPWIGLVRDAVVDRLRGLPSDTDAAMLLKLLSPAPGELRFHQQLKDRERQLPMSQVSRNRIHEATLRTVYLSKIPKGVHLAALMSCLSQYGTVLKARLCKGGTSGGTDQYAFCEMDSVYAAQSICSTGCVFVHGYSLRAHPAKSPIQDASASDAVLGSDGSVVRHCVFGQAQLQ